MSLWSSYKGLPPRTRGLIGVALMVNASAMLLFSDQIEGMLGIAPNTQEQQKLVKVYPVERGNER
ncbi:hypothetical protein LTS17_009692 [Exophiala oligosperma]